MADVSIVLPTYNGARYLKGAVDSILAQTYQDWELILVDDASADGTAELADGYAALDSRIRVIHNETNQRLPQSLNIGFSMAEGRYLTWTSDDNLYMEEALARMVAYLESHDYVFMVRGNMLLIDAEDKVIGELEAYSDRKMYSHNCLGACFLYKREVRDKIGDYDPSLFCVEDYDYWLRVLERFGRIASIDDVLYRYRIHQGSLSKAREQQVKNQLARLRERYADLIFKRLQDRDALWKVYFEMRNSGYFTQEMAGRFMEVFPALHREVPLQRDRNYIIFGAGAYGEMAAGYLGERASFFMDSNPEKAGSIKCGREVLAFEDAVSLSGSYGYLLAAAGANLYKMMLLLQEAGVREYSIFEPDWKC